jgi:hypothetical protein
MYRWSGGTLKHINRRHILGRNRCAGDAPAGYECIEPEVLAAMPLLRSVSQFLAWQLYRSRSYGAAATRPMLQTIAASSKKSRLFGKREA